MSSTGLRTVGRAALALATLGVGCMLLGTCQQQRPEGGGRRKPPLQDGFV